MLDPQAQMLAPVPFRPSVHPRGGGIHAFTWALWPWINWLLPIVGIWWLVFSIIGSVKSANGELYRYPLTIRMFS